LYSINQQNTHFLN